MAGPSTATITVDRISNSGNAIAQERVDGKFVHVRASQEIGATMEVKLLDKGSYFEATLVDRAEETQPRQPGIGPDTSEVGQDLLDPSSDSHSFTVRKSISEGPVDEELRSWISSRKM